MWSNEALAIIAILTSVLSIMSSVSVMTWLYRKGVKARDGGDE